jgi:hypothetical protein
MVQVIPIFGVGAWEKTKKIGDWPARRGWKVSVSNTYSFEFPIIMLPPASMNVERLFPPITVYLIEVVDGRTTLHEMFRIIIVFPAGTAPKSTEQIKPVEIQVFEMVSMYVPWLN